MRARETEARFGAEPEQASFSEEFLLALIHDTRSLLRRSLTSAQILERAQEDLSEDVRVQLESVIAANQNLDLFLGRLAELANASQPFAGPPLPLTVVVSAAVTQATQGCDDGSSVQVEISDDVLVSPALQRVFNELLRNAMLFRNSAAPAVRVTSEVEGGRCQIEFQDNGIGIEKEYLERVFEPLVRLHSRDTYPGFGLGLAISRRILDSLGGKICLRSAPDQGSVAVVEVPVAGLTA